MFIAALLTVAKTWIKKTWYICTMDYLPLSKCVPLSRILTFAPYTLGFIEPACFLRLIQWQTTENTQGAWYLAKDTNICKTIAPIVVLLVTHISQSQKKKKKSQACLSLRPYQDSQKKRNLIFKVGYQVQNRTKHKEGSDLRVDHNLDFV